MSYSAVIVEDESILRASFMRHINWAACGFSPVYDYASAEQAVAHMQANGFPDLLLTDIRLFKMSGIDLCRYVQEHSPHTRKLLLTGYSDFTYAKQAISLHVEEYLLKPIEPAEMEKILRACSKQLQASKAQADVLLAAYGSRRRCMETMLSELVCGSALPLDGENEAAARELAALCEKSYLGVCIQYALHGGVREPLPAEFLLREFFRGELALSGEDAGGGFLFSLEHRRLACLLFGADAEPAAQRLRGVLARAAAQYPHLVFSAGIALTQSGAAHVRGACEQASTACRLAAALGGGSVVRYPDASLACREDGGADLLRDSRIAAFLAQGSWEKALALLNEQLDEVKNRQPIALESIQGACVNFITRLYHEVPLPAQEDISPLLSRDVLAVMSAASVDDIKQAFTGILGEYGRALAENRLQTPRNTVDVILDHLHRNYASAVTLDDLSRVVYLNPRYICSIIKRDTGKTFYEILTEIRITRACELLRDPAMKMYEISHSVGFRDAKIFNNAFKRVTGQTPSQYRQGLKTD